MEPQILVKFASRSRPARFLEGLKSIFDLAANKEGITVFFSCDFDDYTMAPWLDNWLDSPENTYQRITGSWGKTTTKVEAINRHVYDDIDWKYLVNFSDDMRFTVYGWDTLIRDGFRCNGDDLFLHYPDSTAKGMLSTMSIMDRKYFDRDGYIYHPSYKSLWCDNEAQDVAKIRGCYRYMGIQIFDHFHPAYGMADWDEQYKRQQKDWDADEANYYYRKANNFFLDGNQAFDTNSDCTGAA